MCNSVARDAMQDGNFPRFSEKNIRGGIKAVEDEMATEIINSFQKVYKNAGEILYALKSLGPVFSGNDLDRQAKETAALWEDRYDKYKFRRLVAELGAVGVVRQGSERSGHMVADFEYFLPDRLFISNNDRCVIHPLFYKRLDIDRWFKDNGTFRVLPFPEGPNFEVLRDVRL